MKVVEHGTVSHVMPIDRHVGIIEVAEVSVIDVEGACAAFVAKVVNPQIMVVIRTLNQRLIDISAIDGQPAYEVGRLISVRLEGD